ncbi:hypothetical protein SAMN04515667_0251 [Formosa sp. Hel1_31_208]|uniref:DUF5686 family protein n=1 Tax=Formosa sp. Hel1_31_208 TaxID=1798225 RepID=UPI00087CCDB1|nr:DUF5686 family protein [Formosa sp. Hel1_31_208]SDR67983.1 hypothetical protein SAMN04515667_0251 [Formosa sp. Hel1_31_208]
MHKIYCLILFTLFTCALYSQNPPPSAKDTISVAQDSLKKREFLKQLGNGFLPTKFINLDLRYLIKFNQYEGLRTGLGGVTNENFSKKYRVNSYVVYGFKDHRFKYKIGGGFRINEASNTWINLSYTDDLQETGSSIFLTDKRFFSFFEPRLLNIDLFHKHITKALAIEHQFSDHLLSETEFAISKIDPTYDYTYNIDGVSYDNFEVSTAKVSLQWSPKSDFETSDGTVVERKTGYPRFTLQFTQSFKDILNGDFNFFKTDFRAVHHFTYNDDVFTQATLTSGLALGNTPLTHLYHAYPNNITKETVLQRFSVAGINSFETMYFNEFFSDRFATLQIKHFVKPFKITERYRPQLVLISRFAFGDMSNIERHQNIEFSTLSKGYSEAGIELNKLLFGFGLSFAYRYGAYHLPSFADNIAAKFTFNVTL